MGREGKLTPLSDLPVTAISALPCHISHSSPWIQAAVLEGTLGSKGQESFWVCKQDSLLPPVPRMQCPHPQNPLPHLTEVNFNQLVILAARVRYQVILEFIS
jgi:hypothetical protein